MATVCGHDEGGRRLIDLYLTDLAAELASRWCLQETCGTHPGGGTRPPARARSRAWRGSGDRAVRACAGPGTRGRPRCSSGRRPPLDPRVRGRAPPLRLAALCDPLEHAAAGPVGRAAGAPHVEALRLRRCVRARSAARADRGGRGLAAAEAHDAGRADPCRSLTGGQRGRGSDRRRPVGAGRPGQRHNARPQPGRDRVPGLCRSRVASIGGACQSPHLRPISPT